MRCRESRCVPDHVNRTFKILKDVRIPEPDNAIAEFLQFMSSFLINKKILRFIVLTAVKFDNQLAIVAGKVCDVCSNWNLAAEMAILVLEQPKLLPQLLLRISNITAKFTRELIGH
jgi:hypothetical protein